ncbi:hypothetical protein CPB84DRAFT_1775430 [Gymnopilus junonius]|uniref:Uncharacterized protein n=1 Tax=Gymnopilus junonius TaxID=109634 RepID=A0A9P5TPI3_GYMJU|nr:hypothetical protein CPB84DRAFT_1775430 [Gymnopilus junonius]
MLPRLNISDTVPLETPPASPSASECSWVSSGHNTDAEPCGYTLPVSKKDVPLARNTPDHIKAFMLSEIAGEADHETIIRIWNVSPNLRLDKDLQRNHVQLGDVGYFNRHGTFCTVFNIFMTKKMNLKMHYVPPPYFVPFKTGLRDEYTDLRSFDREYHASKGFERCKEDEKGDCLYSFSSPSVLQPDSPGCTVLITPEGVRIHMINDGYLVRIRQYLREQAESWYRDSDLFGDGPLFNGSLLLVETCYKANIWASAALGAEGYKPGLKARLKQPNLAAKIFNWDVDEPIEVERGSSKPDIVDSIDFGNGWSIAVEISSIWYGSQPRGARSSRGPLPHHAAPKEKRFSFVRLTSRLSQLSFINFKSRPRRP